MDGILHFLEVVSVVVIHSMSFILLKRGRKIKSKTKREKENKKKNAIWTSSHFSLKICGGGQAEYPSIMKMSGEAPQKGARKESQPTLLWSNRVPS